MSGFSILNSDFINLELMKSEKPSRAFDNFDPDFYRTLTELRKHQKWKRKMQVVDVAVLNLIDTDVGEKSLG
jgi:hypothetical protein